MQMEMDVMDADCWPLKKDENDGELKFRAARGATDPFYTSAVGGPLSVFQADWTLCLFPLRIYAALVKLCPSRWERRGLGGGGTHWGT